MVVTRPRFSTSIEDRRAAVTSNVTMTPAAKASTIRNGVVTAMGKARRTALGGSRVEQLIAELLDGHNRIREHRHFFAQAPDVDVNGPRAARIGVAPDIGEQQVARQDAAAVLHQVLEQQEFL